MHSSITGAKFSSHHRIAWHQELEIRKWFSLRGGCDCLDSPSFCALFCPVSLLSILFNICISQFLSWPFSPSSFYTQTQSLAAAIQQCMRMCVCRSIYGQGYYQPCHPSLGQGSPPTTEIWTNCFRWHTHTHIHTRVNFWQEVLVAPGRAFSLLQHRGVL